MSEPIGRYTVKTTGPQVVLTVRDVSGRHWSVGAILSDVAMAYEGADIGIIAVPVDEVLHGGAVVKIQVVAT